ncbi:MAG: ATP-binding protein [Victivallales bacterium]
MGRNKDILYISRIRLVNFHNFTDETISIPDGGHLFMLGDNASGKTTILDAIHYVLTAGEEMEFNAAARVTGSRQQGRRVQSIITRYNVDTGHMRPSGGVAYAALEISVDGRSSVTTIAVGMSVNSPDDQVTRWGIVRDCPLEEVPFLISEPDGDRPRDKAEMKKALDDSGFFGQLQAFRNHIAERFLGGKDKFKDFCHFLKIGKAYREIAAHTSDYHVLFKQLLPEADQEVFDRVIVALKSIEGSRCDLENLDKRLAYARNLISLMDCVTSSNRNAAAFEAAGQLIRTLHLKQSIDEDQKSIGKHESDQKKLASSLSKLEEQELNLVSRHNDLKAKDSGGALTREQELRAKLKLMKERLDADGAVLEKLRDKLAGLESESASLEKKLRGSLESLLMKLPDSSIKSGIGTGTAAGAVENFLHGACTDWSLPETELEKLTADVRDAASGIKLALNTCEEAIKGYRISEDKLKAEEKALRERKEAVPERNGFDLLQEELERGMINHVPVYKGLEWHPDLDETQKGEMEEFIGEEILSIITVHEDCYEEAAELVFKEHPGHRLAVANPISKSSGEFREWAKEFFDVMKCNPQVLDILLQELSSVHAPAFEKRKGVRVAKFRSHARSFSGASSRFIGTEARENEQKRKLREISTELKENGELLRKHEKEQKDLKARLRIFSDMETLVSHSVKDIRDDVHKRKGIVQSLGYGKESLAEMERKTTAAAEEISTGQIHLEKLHELIRENDFEALSRTMKEVETQLGRCRKEIETVKESALRCKIQIEEAQARIKKNGDLLKEKQDILGQQLMALERDYGQAEPATFVEKLRVENRLYVESDAMKKVMEHRQQLSAKQAEIGIGIRDMEGASYGFNYDPEGNRIITRGGLSISALEETLRKNVEDQRMLINERTTELFKKLIMDTMLRTLWNSVNRLEKMVADINSLLKGRRFGNNTYRIKIKPNEQYEGLLKLIKSYTNYNPEVEEKLGHFFEDHKDVLAATIPGMVPEMLDYRNWYNYEMCVHSASGDGTVMDSRVKSIGSGGEQAVPNYLLVLTIAHFMYGGSSIRLNILLFDEAFYGIDSQRRDQLMGFATDLGLQLFVASPDQDGVRDEIACSTSLLVVKDSKYDVHLYPFDWKRNPGVFEAAKDEGVRFSKET